MVDTCPTNIGEFQTFLGLDDAKVFSYWKRFLDVLKKYSLLGENGGERRQQQNSSASRLLDGSSNNRSTVKINNASSSKSDQSVGRSYEMPKTSHERLQETSNHFQPYSKKPQSSSKFKPAPR